MDMEKNAIMEKKQKLALFSRANITGRVTNKHGDYALLACCFVTGLLDCSTFNNWSVFVGMQTGNTVILALSSARLPTSQPYAWLATLVSLGSFLLGGFFTFRLSTYFGPMRRSTLSLNFLIQGLLIVISASIVTADLIPIDNLSSLSDYVLHDIRYVAAIPPLAMQSGAQIAVSRMLGFNELPVNVLTSTYADLVGDKDLFKWDNTRRNRRLAAFVLLFGGALCAAWMMRKGPGIEGTMWVGAGIKIATSVAVFLFMESAA